eukprot:464098-Amphidinium_carterae.1
MQPPFPELRDFVKPPVNLELIGLLFELGIRFLYHPNLLVLGLRPPRALLAVALGAALLAVALGAALLAVALRAALGNGGSSIRFSQRLFFSLTLATLPCNK